MRQQKFDARDVQPIVASSFRYERQILDSNGDGWCDIWCMLNTYKPTKDRLLDSDNDGVSDYDEMVHLRHPFLVERTNPRILSDAEIQGLRKRREANAKAPKKAGPTPPPSTRWKTPDQIIDLTKIPQRTDLKPAKQSVPYRLYRTGCDPTANLLGDDDNDGLNNLMELACGLPACGTNIGLIPGTQFSLETIGAQIFPSLEFRALELPDLTYGYQVQESTDLLSWNDVDMYANRLGITNVTDNGTIDLVKVRSSLPISTYPRTYMRLQPIAPWPPQPIEFASVTVNDIITHTHTNVLAILPDNTLHKKIFDSYSSTVNTTSEWARFSWTNDIRTTGVSFDLSSKPPYPTPRPFTCTLISPRHVLMAAHYARNPGDKVIFHNGSGGRVERTIVDVLATEAASINNYPARDIAVGLLDSAIDPSEIPYYRVLPKRSDWATHLTGALIPITRQNRFAGSDTQQIVVRRISGFIYGPNGTRHMTFNFDTQELPDFYEGGFVNGDSGGPSFALIRGEPILIHILAWSTGRGPFISDPEIFDTINGFMSALGGGHNLKSIYLNP